jgi:hypothetical protein
MPMRNCSRSAGARPALRWRSAFCTSTAQRTAETALGNSAMTLSPAVLAMRPPCWRMRESMMLRAASRRFSVRSSSAPMRAL